MDTPPPLTPSERWIQAQIRRTRYVSRVCTEPPLDGVRSMALVHEWLSSRAGSEKTFEQMASVFPAADLYALSIDQSVPFRIDRPVRSTVLQRSRFLSDRRVLLALPFMPLAWKTMTTPDYDVVVTSSHAFSRYFPTAAAVHLSYVYTPLRYAWLPSVDGRAASPVLAPARSLLRSLDKRSTRECLCIRRDLVGGCNKDQGPVRA